MFCPKCGKDVGNVKFCPDCGLELSTKEGQDSISKKRPKKKHPIFKAVVIVCLVLILGSGALMMSTPPSTGPSTSESSGADVEDLELLDYTTTTEGYVRYVIGHIKNNSAKTYSYVQVDINTYAGDTQVGSSLANVTNLAAGDTWEFKAVILEDNADSFRIVNISGW